MPAGATIAHYKGLGLDLIPGTGMLPACNPSLKRFDPIAIIAATASRSSA